jgi:quinol monooxygenase YgiN
MFNQDTCCTVAPYFEVPVENLRAFKALGQQFATKARSESGCMYYTFSFSGTTAHCREGYINAEAILAHLENVSELLEKALKISKIIRLEIHAPAAELEKLKNPLTSLNPHFFALEEGIRRSGI